MRAIRITNLLLAPEPARVAFMRSTPNLLECNIIEPKAPADAAIIWLHGLGASAHDFDAIIPQLQAHSHHNVRFIFPQAPERAITINQGHQMPAWYDIYSLDRKAPQDRAGIVQSGEHIDRLILEQLKQGISPDAIILAGFSQGGAMALHVGLHSQYPLAGIAALSCYLPLAQELYSHPPTLSCASPIYMAHGTFDTVVPLALGMTSVQILEQLHYQVNFQKYAMAHEICQQQITDIALWINTCLGDKPLKSHKEQS